MSNTTIDGELRSTTISSQKGIHHVSMDLLSLVFVLMQHKLAEFHVADIDKPRGASHLRDKAPIVLVLLVEHLK